jgi:hypothetical protein
MVARGTRHPPLRKLQQSLTRELETLSPRTRSKRDAPEAKSNSSNNRSRLSLAGSLVHVHAHDREEGAEHSKNARIRQHAVNGGRDGGDGAGWVDGPNPEGRKAALFEAVALQTQVHPQPIIAICVQVMHRFTN